MPSAFFDEVVLQVNGGKGGNGMVNFHREKFIAHGPPDGGNGGDGGSVILEADEDMSTFQKYSGTKTYKGGDGVGGHKNNRTGGTGEEVILKVPCGTLVYDFETNELIVDLKRNGDRFLIAKGGRGGKGNASFVSSTRQAPKFAEVGDIGEERHIRLEMQLVADIGLIGFPSAGKSTLISHLSSARPKIGDYPFTTLVPNLGVVFVNDFKIKTEDSFVVADMPGIIEGASEGKGLGDRFLRHMSRTASLVFLLDPFSYDGKSMQEQYEILRKEIQNYKPELLEKDYFVVMNKIDAIPDEDRELLTKEFLAKFPKEKSKFLIVSGVSGENIRELVLKLWESVKESKTKEEVILPEEDSEEEHLDYTPHLHVDEQSFEVKFLYDVEVANFEPLVYGNLISESALPNRKLWQITGARIEQISRMSNLEQEGALHRLYDVLEKMNITNELRRSGAKNGDYLKIAWHFIEYHDL